MSNRAMPGRAKAPAAAPMLVERTFHPVAEPFPMLGEAELAERITVPHRLARTR